MQLADFLPRFLQEEFHGPQLVLWICVSRHSLLPRGEVSQPRLVRAASQQKGRERPVGRPNLGSHTSLHWGRHAWALPDAARLDLDDIAECLHQTHSEHASLGQFGILFLQPLTEPLHWEEGYVSFALTTRLCNSLIVSNVGICVLPEEFCKC